MQLSREVIAKIYTTKELNDLLYQIAKIGESARTNLAEVNPGVPEVLKELGIEGNREPPEEDLAKKLKNLKDFLVKLPKARLEFAFEPNEEFIRKISRLLNVGRSDHLVLEITVKRDLLAGATIEFMGNFRDYSYASILDQVVKEKVKGAFS
ncbi:MAG: hypothetical protein WD231_04615 [Candidatus Woykebacteria bacterium]